MGAGCLDDATLLAFLDGTLAPPARAQTEAHLASCSACTDLTTWAAADLASRRGAPGERRRPIIGELAIGSQVGRYQILGALGRGGMGEVYAAYHPDLERRIALKIVDESGPDSAERRARLLREARAIARLSHQNVVTVHDAGTVGDRVYIAMELVEGDTVDAWLRAERRTWREVVDVFIAAGRGLAAAHAAEIVHRDFKPQNIMIGRDGTVRVMDFGLARLVNDEAAVLAPTAGDSAPVDSTPAVTKTGALLGTPAYMAPEQFRGEPTDARSDQFSFCVALHEALYGKRPRVAGVDGESPTPPELGDRHRRVPAWLRGAVLRGLQPNPGQRFESMNRLLHVLDRGRTRARRRTIAVTAGLAAVLAIAGGWRASHRPRFDCGVPAGRLAATWPLEGGPGSRRDRLERALLATGRSDAMAVWGQVAASLDAHVGKWAAAYQDTCEATHVRGEQSTEVLDLRMRCLSQNLDEIRALTDVLLTSDAHAVGQAVTAAGGLPSTAMCSDSARLRAKVPLPHDEQTLRKVETLQRAVNDARALLDVGYGQAALEKARALQRDVAAIGYAPLTAQLLLVIGTIRTDLGDFMEAETATKDAFVAAESGSDEALRAEAASLLIFIVGVQGRREESELWVRDANAILDRLGPGYARLRSWVLQNQGWVLAKLGDLEPARRALEASVALKEQVLGSKHPDVAISLLSLGGAYKQLGKLDEALAVEDRALAIWEGQGTLHAAKVQSNRGEILAALGRDAEAEQAFQRALQLFDQETDPDDVDRADLLVGLAEIKLAAGDTMAAISFFERALDLRERKEKVPELVASTRFGLARALWYRSATRARALALARSARTVYAAGKHTDELAKIDGWLATRTAGERKR